MIGAVFATDESQGFGNNGQIPWNVPEDYRHFKNVTLGGKIVMGKGTFESLPNLLVNREHIVVSSTLEPGEGYKVYDTPQDVLDNEGNNFWVIGGPELIKAFHRLVGYDLIYYTMIRGTHEADVKFNKLDEELLSYYTISADRVKAKFEVIKFVNEDKF